MSSAQEVPSPKFSGAWPRSPEQYCGIEYSGDGFVAYKIMKSLEG